MGEGGEARGRNESRPEWVKMLEDDEKVLSPELKMEILLDIAQGNGLLVKALKESKSVRAFKRRLPKLFSSNTADSRARPYEEVTNVEAGVLGHLHPKTPTRITAITKRSDAEPSIVTDCRLNVPVRGPSHCSAREDILDMKIPTHGKPRRRGIPTLQWKAKLSAKHAE